MKPFDMREWLERERLSGLPHADFAADALVAIAERDDMAEGDEAWRDEVNRKTGDVVADSDQIVEAFVFRDHVRKALWDAGLIEENPTAQSMAALLRMFLPC